MRHAAHAFCPATGEKSAPALIYQGPGVLLAVIFRHNPNKRGKHIVQPITKTHDNSIKLILKEPELMAEFLHNFISIDILKGIDPSDIEDVTERFLSPIAEQKDGDTVKRIKIKGEKPLFVITIIEHESAVNFRAPFKMLYYMVMILDAYEKEANRQTKGIGRTKGFKYPPILPIIFYNGTGKWTAARTLSGRTEMNDIFAKYIPKFDYELVDLNKYSVTDLVQFENMLSLLMILGKIKKKEDFSIMGKVPEEFFKKIEALNIPEHMQALPRQMMEVLLTKIDVPKEEIEDIVSRIDERGLSEMIAIENYSVRETRREARAEGRAEGKAEGRAEGKAEGRAEIAKAAAEYLLSNGSTISDIAAILKITEEEIKVLLPDLSY